MQYNYKCPNMNYTYSYEDNKNIDITPVYYFYDVLFFCDF